MRRLVGVIVGAGVAGCSALPGIGEPQPVAREPVFDECRDEEYAYYGTSSLAQLSLDTAIAFAEVSSEDAARVGQVWVTEGRTNDFGGLRVACVEFADGQALRFLPVDDDWVPPGSLPSELGGGFTTQQAVIVGFTAVAIIGGVGTGVSPASLAPAR